MLNTLEGASGVKKLAAESKLDYISRMADWLDIPLPRTASPTEHVKLLLKDLGFPTKNTGSPVQEDRMACSSMQQRKQPMAECGRTNGWGKVGELSGKPSSSSYEHGDESSPLVQRRLGFAGRHRSGEQSSFRSQQFTYSEERLCIKRARIEKEELEDRRMRSINLAEIEEELRIKRVRRNA